MTLRFTKPIKLIVTILFVSFLMLGTVTAQAMGGTGYEIVGDSNGLEIKAPDPAVNVGNLNPGDEKNSRLRLTNNNSRAITVYIRTEIVSENTPSGGSDLADGMYLTIMDGNTTVSSGTFREAHEANNISLGRMAAGAVKVLEFYADLPGGKGTGNEYQGSSMKVTWVFTTESSGGGGGGGGGGDDDDDDDDEPGINIPEEPTPFGPAGEEDSFEQEGIIMPEDEQVLAMPKTGEGLPYPFYIAGACAVIAGVGLIRKKKS